MNPYTVALLALLFLSLVFAFYYIWSLTLGAPYVPSLGKSRKIMKELAKEYLAKHPGSQAAELGAGDCLLSFMLADLGYKTKAYELNPFLTIWARFLKLIKQEKNIEIYNKNIFNVHYDGCNLAIIYLYPHLMRKLEPILFKEMPKGGWIISNTFSFKEHKPLRQVDKVLVYEVV